jgi:two-component system sensor histidine kinase DesK
MSSPDTISKARPRNGAWIWLGYTGFLFIEPLIEPNRNLWLGTFAAFAAFLGIFFSYVRATDEGRKTRFWLIGATFVLGLITFPWNQGASTFFVYAASFLPFSTESTRRVLWLFLFGSFIILAEGYVFILYFHDGPFHIGWPNTFIAIFLVIIIGGGNIFFAEQRRADCKLRAAQEENLVLAAVAERERIARDLHDVLGHTLSVIVLKAELAGRLLSIDSVRATSEIADVERIARTSLAEVREAIGGYRARGLAAEIEAARLTLDAAGVRLLAESLPSYTVALSSQEETALSLALREAITNIVRHSRATICRLRFVTEAGRWCFSIEDDGHQIIVREGNGLRGMRERIESLGGRFSIECNIVDKRGSRLIIELPHREASAS